MPLNQFVFRVGDVRPDEHARRDSGEPFQKPPRFREMVKHAHVVDRVEAAECDGIVCLQIRVQDCDVADAKQVQGELGAADVVGAAFEADC